MSTSIELHNVVAVQINDTDESTTGMTKWRDVHFHKANGETVTVTLWPHRKGGTVSVVIGNDEFNPNQED